MLMRMPAVELGNEEADGTDRYFQCVNIDVEIVFWMSNINKLKWSPLEADKPLLIELIKFAYDSYILYGGLGKESSWVFLMMRFKTSKLSAKIRTPCAEIIFVAIWARVYGE